MSKLTVKEVEAIGVAFEEATKKMRVAAGQGMQAADALHAAHEANVEHREAVNELARVQTRIAKSRQKNLEDILDFKRSGTDFTEVVFKFDGDTTVA